MKTFKTLKMLIPILTAIMILLYRSLTDKYDIGVGLILLLIMIVSYTICEGITAVYNHIYNMYFMTKIDSLMEKKFGGKIPKDMTPEEIMRTLVEDMNDDTK